MEVHAHLAGVDFPDHIQNQGKVSEWTQQQFNRHSKITKEWRDSKKKLEGKANFELVVRATGGFTYSSFNINKGLTVDYVTISARDSNNTICLDYGDKAGPGVLVSVANCYPSFDADKNRDKAQQWVWGKDASIRPYSDQNLCLTNAFLEDDDTVYLINCYLNTVEQNWGYSGAAPGNYDSGEIFFGSATLGVITV